jgi:nitrogen fixation/metabolism regulation signal transduction histidine kinase
MARSPDEQMNQGSTLPTVRHQSRRKTRRVSHDARIFFMAMLAGLPSSLVALILLWNGDYTPKVQWTLTVLILGFWFGFSSALRGRVVLPLQTLSNLLAALREGDYSIRARGGKRDDPLGEVILEVNALGATLREQRLGALEATALLTKVMEEIDVAIFALDGRQLLRLVNRAGERVLAQPAERILGRSATDLGLSECLQGDAPRLLDVNFPGGVGRFELHRSSFRQAGLPHQLLVLTDLSRALRQEERKAWQRLIRVLGHELNNSLAPIKSITASLESLLVKQPPPPDWREDMERGLAVIGARGEALSRFMEGYARLAQLPPPRRQPMQVDTWIRRVVRLETRMNVALAPGPPITIQADGDQLDQLLINLLRNAADASLVTGGGVNVGWKKTISHIEVWVDDEGPGLSNTANLFVPFFTTKPQGSGIGLVLSRQIAEAHGGALSLENHKNGPGCRARLRLPL